MNQDCLLICALPWRLTRYLTITLFFCCWFCLVLQKCYHPWTLKFSKKKLRIIWSLNFTGHHNRKQHAPLSTDTLLALSLVLSAPIFFIQRCLGRMSLIYGTYVVLFYSFWENRSTSGHLPSTQHFILPLTFFFFLITHTFPLQWIHQGQFGVLCLSQGHFKRWSVWARDHTTDHLTNRSPPFPVQQQPSQQQKCRWYHFVSHKVIMHSNSSCFLHCFTLNVMIIYRQYIMLCWRSIETDF